MKKVLILVLTLILSVAACGNNNDNKDSSSKKDSNSDTKSFTMDNGKKVDIPKDPKRIAVLHPTYVGALVKFDAMTSTYKDNTTKLAELVGEEDKAKEWIKEWDKKLKNDREELDPLIKGKTATVLQQTPKGLMAFSDELGRGTEILYSGWGLKQPEDLKKATEKTNAISITPEEFDKYLGDFVVIAANGDQKAPFEDTNVWANTEAKKNDHVVKFDVSETQYNDPISLEKQREIFLKAFKEMK
ncbi:ABC transporter substrate-binding protein [Mammaliicoccus sciuri]|uniref:ABC transporter substrate-binding protein n=1 Tax=Mammaliicoccus sciuri TaxID=1296 RepID=UPI003F549B95